MPPSASNVPTALRHPVRDGPDGNGPRTLAALSPGPFTMSSPKGSAGMSPSASVRSLASVSITLAVCGRSPSPESSLPKRLTVGGLPPTLGCPATLDSSRFGWGRPAEWCVEAATEVFKPVEVRRPATTLGPAGLAEAVDMVRTGGLSCWAGGWLAAPEVNPVRQELAGPEADGVGAAPSSSAWVKDSSALRQPPAEVEGPDRG